MLIVEVDETRAEVGVFLCAFYSSVTTSSTTSWIASIEILDVVDESLLSGLLILEDD